MNFFRMALCVANLWSVCSLGRDYWKECRIVRRLTEQGEQMAQDGEQRIPSAGERIQKSGGGKDTVNGSSEVLLQLFLSLRRRRHFRNQLLFSGAALLICLLNLFGE